MSDMLSQAELDALLNGLSQDDASGNGDSGNNGAVPGNSDISQYLTPMECDALGEIGNISMGSAATALFTLINQKVDITTPTISVKSWAAIQDEYEIPYVGVKIQYTEGLKGANLLILKESDVKVITDLMMGGDGTNVTGETTDLHLSAIGEAMNQMVGYSSTSMSTMFSKKIDISPPGAFKIDLPSSTPKEFEEFRPEEMIVKVAFKMEIGNLIDSEIMQILPLDFAKNLISNLLGSQETTLQQSVAQPPEQQPPMQEQYPQPPMQQQYPQPPIQQQYPQPPMQEQYPQPPIQQQYPQPPIQQQYPQPPIQQQYPQPPMQQQYQQPPMQQQYQQPVYNAQPVQFDNFETTDIPINKENMSLIMDVSLDVTVELGRTQRLISEILELSPGAIVELDKLAGEPIDVLVNGKCIAKGEVVVIDECFGVRITDILSPSKRL